MADQRFVYQVTIDGAAAQAAARRLRDVFEKELAQAGQAAAKVSVRETTDRAALQAARQAEREKVAAAREAAREQTALAREAAKEAAQAAREAATAVKRADQDETSSAGAAARSRAIAAKMAADEAAAAARAAAAAVRRADEEGAASARATAQERAAAARQAADQTIAAAKEAARAQEAAAQQQARGGRTLGGTLRSIDNLLAFGVGGLAGYGVAQAGQQLYGMGREGAGMERTALLLEQSARNLNVSSRGMIDAITKASRGTVSEAGAEQFALQLISQKWAPLRDDIARDAAVMTEAARRLSPRIPTAEGSAMTSAELQGRFLSYIVEGNKEIIDQLGFSNVMVAKAAGVENQNLSAGDRAQGLIKLLEGELARLPEVALTNAEQIERAAAQFEDAMNRIKVSLAGPTAAAATFAADIISNVTGNGPARDLAATRQTVQVYRGPKPEEAPANAAQQAAEQYLDVAGRYDKAVSRNAQAAMAFTDELNRLGQALISQGNLTGEQYTRLNQLAVRLDLVAKGQDAYTLAMSKTTMEGLAQNDQLFQVAGSMQRLEDRYTAGQIPLSEYTRQVGALANWLGVLAGAAGLAATGIDAVNGAARSKPGSGIALPDSLSGGQIGIFRTPDRGKTRDLQQSIPDAAGGRTGTDPLTGARTGVGAKGDRNRAGDPWDTFGEEVADYQKQQAEKAAREWESAANKTAREFEQAAEAAARAFEDSLGKVPGLMGASSVTEADMEAAKGGYYQDKADERLRQLANEVLNGVETPEDAADWARRMGMDPGTDPKRVYAEARARWDDSSLFAGGQNLDLVRWDAVQADRERQAAAASGRQAILDYANGLYGPQGVTPEARAGYAARPDVGAALTSTQPQQPQQPPVEAQQDRSALLEELLAGITPEAIGGEAAKTLAATGESIFAAIKGGYDRAATAADWSTPVVDALAAQVAPMVLEMLEDQL